MQKTSKKISEDNEIDIVNDIQQTGKKSSVISREIDKVVKENGVITPTLLIDVARSETHPLHNYFEWDDSVAAHRYRLNQARSMIIAQRFTCQINEVKNDSTTITISKRDVRKLLPDYEAAGRFLPRAEVLNEIEMRAIIIERKKTALRAWCNSVADIEELESVRLTIASMIG